VKQVLLGWQQYWQVAAVHMHLAQGLELVLQIEAGHRRDCDPRCI
jgi:hypothetical protein